MQKCGQRLLEKKKIPCSLDKWKSLYIKTRNLQKPEPAYINQQDYSIGDIELRIIMKIHVNWITPLWRKLV